MSILFTYSGKSGKCMCGCAGKYSYATGTPREEWQGGISDRSVAIISRKVLNNPAREAREFQDGGEPRTVVYVDDGSRMRAVYFRGFVADRMLLGTRQTKQSGV